MLLRQGGRARPRTRVSPASYGGDQAGAVLRYALVPDSRFAPAAYARIGKALSAGGEAELAGGLSLRPLRAVPVRINAEARVSEREGRVDVRPAAFVTAGLWQREIGPALEADGYVQAGYVGGAFDTAFVDGRAILEAPVFARAQSRLAIGGGMWGGAQRDAARLDIGPSASATFSTGGATIRASIDHRFRIAGDADPDGGFALTLSASF